jgi:DNA-binding NtrC family response regulator
MCPAGVPKVPGKILVVEDEVLARLAVGQFLRDLGYAVAEATDASDAMRTIRADPSIVLVFTDVVLPGDQDGHALADWLGVHHPKIKIVIASGIRPDHASALPFLLKPYAFSDLRAEIERLLQPSSRHPDPTSRGTWRSR